MAIDFKIDRGAGHPWDGREGWDMLDVKADSEEYLTTFINNAAKKYWKVWIRDNCGGISAILFKPSGATRDWVDEGLKRHR